MTDTFARMRQLIGSTAEWTAHDIVLGYGEFGIERISATEYRAKVGDGSAKWSALPYLSSGGAGINSSIQTALDAKLPLTGGTLTGSLILAHDGTGANEAVTVTQLNAEVTKLTTADAGKLPIAGGTMTGSLFLAADAKMPLEAVTFEQLNKAVQDMVISAGGGTLTFAGTVDPTITYAAPVPAPQNGNYYTVQRAGAIHATWTAHIVGTHTNVVVGDFLVWDSAASKFHLISNGMNLSAYVPLAGTTGMIGDIVWSGAAGNKKGVAIISGKGGTLDDIVIDDGTF